MLERQDLSRRPDRFEEKRAGVRARGAPRRSRKRPRGSQAGCPLKLEKRGGCLDAPRAAATSPAAAARETDWSCEEGGIRVCARHPGRNTREEGEEGAKGEGRHDRQADSEGAPAGTRGLRGGATAALRPRRTVLFWVPPRRALGAALGPSWVGAGRGGNGASAR